MSLIVSDGSEMIRYNPSTASIEASNSRGISWSMRYRCSGMGPPLMDISMLPHQVASAGLSEGKKFSVVFLNFIRNITILGAKIDKLCTIKN